MVDLADAVSGFAMRNSVSKQPPSEEFLKNMIRKFPDKEKNKYERDKLRQSEKGL